MTEEFYEQDDSQPTSIFLRGVLVGGLSTLILMALTLFIIGLWHSCG